jgi:hypothetical protein
VIAGCETEEALRVRRIAFRGMVCPQPSVGLVLVRIFLDCRLKHLPGILAFTVLQRSESNKAVGVRTTGVPRLTFFRGVIRAFWREHVRFAIPARARGGRATGASTFETSSNEVFDLKPTNVLTRDSVESTCRWTNSSTRPSRIPRLLKTSRFVL